MSQTITETPATPAPDFYTQMHQAEADRLRQTRRGGPAYSDKGHPLVWNGQVFGREIEPTGSVTCEQPLHVGSTQNALDLIIVACNSNAGVLTFPKDATITVTFAMSDKEDGTYEDVGPTVCVTAPEGGISSEPDELVVRVPLGNFKKPWVKPAIAFTGTVTGGNVDVALSMVNR